MGVVHGVGDEFAGGGLSLRGSERFFTHLQTESPLPTMMGMSHTTSRAGEGFSSLDAIQALLHHTEELRARARQLAGEARGICLHSARLREEARLLRRHCALVRIGPHPK